MFQKRIRGAQHKKIKECYSAFYQRGGAIARLQHNGAKQSFPRAAILAIYADHPAAVKCTLTGSSCPVCYTPKESMSGHDPDVEFVMRNPAKMAQRKRVINLIFNSGIPNAKSNARKRARLNGINLDIGNAWSDDNDLSEDCVRT